MPAKAKSAAQGVENPAQSAPRLVLDLPKTKLPVAVLLRELPLTRRVKVVDIGANPMAADAAHKPLLDLGACDVVGFEPQPVAFAELAKIKSDRETYLPYAVGDGRKRALRVYQDHGMTSFLPAYEAGQKAVAMRPWSGLLEEIEFDTKRLDDADLGAFDLLKIDVQGAENEVLAHAAKALAEATVVIVELRFFRLYEGEPMMGGVDSQLRAMGFELHKFLFTKTRSLRNSQNARLRHRYMRDQLIDGDAVYIKDISQIDSFSNAQLMHLSVLASAVFESHSLTLFCLDHLAARGAVPAHLPARYVDALPASMRIEGDTPQGNGG
jgi:FkbM family methyltransferase